jgi:hypothetical protein
MKRKSAKLFLYSFTSLAVMTSGLTHAESRHHDMSGRMTASVGTWLAVPSADNQAYAVDANSQIIENNPDYSWGFEASLGYLFNCLIVKWIPMIIVAHQVPTICFLPC